MSRVDTGTSHERRRPHHSCANTIALKYSNSSHGSRAAEHLRARSSFGRTQASSLNETAAFSCALRSALLILCTPLLAGRPAGRLALRPAESALKFFLLLRALNSFGLPAGRARASERASGRADGRPARQEGRERGLMSIEPGRNLFARLVSGRAARADARRAVACGHWPRPKGHSRPRSQFAVRPTSCARLGSRGPAGGGALASHELAAT